MQCVIDKEQDVRTSGEKRAEEAQRPMKGGDDEDDNLNGNDQCNNQCNDQCNQEVGGDEDDNYDDNLNGNEEDFDRVENYDWPLRNCKDGS